VQKRKLSKIEYKHSLRLGQDINKLYHKKKASSRTQKTKTELKTKGRKQQQPKTITVALFFLIHDTGSAFHS
jgi:hypothetical protein